ncbi:hypothetical protein EXIGLDRAFT_761146 [Exidia glandulosa HHB12029]|uniref:Uncharacterized protein n=1 Tax=Exidia glandulosa HHB12029 TaxID=1314781 RepID=A0A165NS00_EXIGL|nr:hypothetical protein EXIGLDRAFT_761146 [Exidia glandulosa HHB12029]
MPSTTFRIPYWRSCDRPCFVRVSTVGGVFNRPPLALRSVKSGLVAEVTRELHATAQAPRGRLNRQLCVTIGAKRVPSIQDVREVALVTGAGFSGGSTVSRIALACLRASREIRYGAHVVQWETNSAEHGLVLVLQSLDMCAEPERQLHALGRTTRSVRAVLVTRYAARYPGSSVAVDLAQMQPTPNKFPLSRIRRRYSHEDEAGNFEADGTVLVSSYAPNSAVSCAPISALPWTTSFFVFVNLAILSRAVDVVNVCCRLPILTLSRRALRTRAARELSAVSIPYHSALFVPSPRDRWKRQASIYSSAQPLVIVSRALSLGTTSSHAGLAALSAFRMAQVRLLVRSPRDHWIPQASIYSSAQLPVIVSRALPGGHSLEHPEKFLEYRCETVDARHYRASRGCLAQLIPIVHVAERLYLSTLSRTQSSDCSQLRLLAVYDGSGDSLEHPEKFLQYRGRTQVSRPGPSRSRVDRAQARIPRHLSRVPNVDLALAHWQFLTRHRWFQHPEKFLKYCGPGTSGVELALFPLAIVSNGRLSLLRGIADRSIGRSPAARFLYATFQHRDGVRVHSQMHHGVSLLEKFLKYRGPGTSESSCSFSLSQTCVCRLSAGITDRRSRSLHAIFVLPSDVGKAPNLTSFRFVSCSLVNVKHSEKFLKYRKRAPGQLHFDQASRLGTE